MVQPTRPMILPRLDRYPQRIEPQLSPFDAGVLSFFSYLQPLRGRKAAWGSDARIVHHVRVAQDRLPASLGACLDLIPTLRRQLKMQGERLPIVEGAHLLALLQRVAEEVLEQRPYDVQLAATWSLMCGEIAEMGTGEGKSLTAAIAAAALAFRGRQVHILTVNDYLASRDAERFSDFFSTLGLSSGCIEEGLSAEDRGMLYQSNIIFSAAKNVVFDYLRDQTGPSSHVLSGLPAKLSQLIPQDSVAAPILQGLDAVIVDEADSVLIDQAATPFILSGGDAALGGLDELVLMNALQLADKLVEGRHFKNHPALRRVTLTEDGKDWLSSWVDGDQGLLSVTPIREHIVSQALIARHLLLRDRDYLIKEDKIQIIDESTGRIMPDRQWSEGLHQLVEIKEALPPSEIRTTLGRITYQRFFPRYRHLCGMSGTARPAARELWETYGLTVRRILPRRPDRRHWTPIKIFPTATSKWQAIASYVSRLHSQDIPVLIGTRTLDGSRQCSAALVSHGIPHHVLNAEEIEKEATIVSLAGEPGQVTVATNMAGRGTDIILSDRARSVGGLHVILTELHENRRIDLQLAGRCGRQGDLGQVDCLLSLEDTIFSGEAKIFKTLASGLLHIGQIKAAYALMRLLQAKQTRRAEASRRRLQKYERQRERTLALTGALE